ncbi:MAG: metallophosphoesterase [candidate division WOR-3 bacterium]
MNEILIADKSGREVERKVVQPQEVVIFEDKKEAIVNEETILQHLQKARELAKQMEVGQREATVNVEAKYPDLPIFIWLLCDAHYGSIHTDYEALIRDYQIVRDTPNFFVISNGDEVDNFLADMGKWSTGAYETPITPEQQALLIRSLFKKLDEQKKCLCFSFGNHNDWIKRGGLSFEGTWLRDFSCPVLNCGGLLRLRYGSQEYKIAITHRYWGSSKLNPTLMAKRYMEYEYPNADVFFLGHTHQAEYLCFRRDRETEYRWAIIGGTYKADDEYAAKHGIGGRGQLGGFCLVLNPYKRDIFVMRNLEEAKEYFEVLREIKNTSR